LPNGVVVTDASGAIVYVNSAALSMFGYDDEEELLGRRLEVLVPEQLRAVHADQRDEFRRSLHTRPMGIGLGLRGRRRDGSEFPAEIGLAPIRLARGVHVAASVVDIGPRTRMEAALRSDLDRAE
jgi:protein-histidine pros-kinase